MSSFADRGMDMRPRVDLNMARFAEPPMVPKVATREGQRTIINATAGLPTAKVPPAVPKPAKVKAPKPVRVKALPPPRPIKPMPAHPRANAAANKLRKVMGSKVMFTEEIHDAMGQKSPRYTTRLLRTMAERGVVERVGYVGSRAQWRAL